MNRCSLFSRCVERPAFVRSSQPVFFELRMSFCGHFNRGFQSDFFRKVPKAGWRLQQGLGPTKNETNPIKKRSRSYERLHDDLIVNLLNRLLAAAEDQQGSGTETSQREAGGFGNILHNCKRAQADHVYRSGRRNRQCGIDQAGNSRIGGRVS